MVKKGGATTGGGPYSCRSRCAGRGGVAEATEGARARLERGVIEACKQCGRNTLMEIAAGQTIEQMLSGHTEDVHRVIAHPGGRSLDAAMPATVRSVIALVGPEGGFTDDELAAAELDNEIGCVVLTGAGGAFDATGLGAAPVALDAGRASSAAALADAAAAAAPGASFGGFGVMCVPVSFGHAMPTTKPTAAVRPTRPIAGRSASPAGMSTRSGASAMTSLGLTTTRADGSCVSERCSARLMPKLAVGKKAPSAAQV